MWNPPGPYRVKFRTQVIAPYVRAYFYFFLPCCEMSKKREMNHHRELLGIPDFLSTQKTFLQAGSLREKNFF